MKGFNLGSKKRVTVLGAVLLTVVAFVGYLAGTAMFTSPQNNQPDNTKTQDVTLGPSGNLGGTNSMSGCCSGMMGGNMMTSAAVANVIDPPLGVPFNDPAVLEDTNPDPDIVEVNVEAKVAPINVGGVTANLLTYNGQYPGPTIEYKPGDTLKLNFKNSLPNSGTSILGYNSSLTNIHTHGLHVSPVAPSDDPTIQVASGATYNYVYDTSLQAGGTFDFYHCHIHGLTAEQFWGGLTGSLISADPTDLLSDYETHIIFIKDITLNGDQPQPYFSVMDFVMGKEGNTLTVNGLVNPVLDMQPGEVQRWRIINACNARFLRLGLENHSLNLIGTDGGLLDKACNLNELFLSPAERADVLVKADQTSGSYKLLSLPYSNGCGSLPQTTTIMTANYTGPTLNQNIPASINPNATRFNVDDLNMLPHRSLFLSMMGGRGFINGQDFDVDPLTLTSTIGGYEVWDITSQCMMDHVFHIHVNNFQVLGISWDPVGYSLYTQIPALKDSVYVPRGSTVRILVNVADYTGMTMFHCHIVEHEDIGMMGMWNIAPANESMAMS
jgi:FtsP/CotA-like multicopper oxidase with cupredoxin domain